jgi:hypothetical protein
MSENFSDIVKHLPDDIGKMETWSNGKTLFEMFPPGYIALSKELGTGLHPKLEKLLATHPVNEIDVRLAEIASYCQIVLDGTYTLKERDKLCLILAGRLEVLREMPEGQNIILS